MAGEKTEAPTPRRREEARKKGQVARSAELGSVAVLFAGLLTLNSRGGDALAQYRALWREAFLQAGTRDANPEALLVLAGSLIGAGAATMIPLVATVTLVGAAATLAQVGPMLSLEPLKPDLSRINPLQGMKRFFSTRSLVELMKAVGKLAVTGFVAYQVIRERFDSLAGLQTASAEGALAQSGSMILEIGEKCGLALLVMAAADYAYQRRSLESSLMMSKEDVKEEARQSEGDPHLKGKIRRTARQLAARRMMQQVPEADVVVTNPVHLAVALQYKQSLVRAPVVVAKGQLLVAEQIKRVAREHGVPVLENPPLARALFRSVEIGDAIPAELYQAVAEVLAFVYRLRGPGRVMSDE